MTGLLMLAVCNTPAVAIEARFSEDLGTGN
jgi:hypothetical protein